MYSLSSRVDRLSVEDGFTAAPPSPPHSALCPSTKEAAAAFATPGGCLENPLGKSFVLHSQAPLIVGLEPIPLKGHILRYASS